MDTNEGYHNIRSTSKDDAVQFSDTANHTITDLLNYYMSGRANQMGTLWHHWKATEPVLHSDSTSVLFLFGVFFTVNFPLGAHLRISEDWWSLGGYDWTWGLGGEEICSGMHGKWVTLMPSAVLRSQERALLAHLSFKKKRYVLEMQHWDMFNRVIWEIKWRSGTWLLFSKINFLTLSCYISHRGRKNIHIFLVITVTRWMDETV